MPNIYWFISRYCFLHLLCIIFHLTPTENRNLKIFAHLAHSAWPHLLKRESKFIIWSADGENCMRQQDRRWGKFLVFGRAVVLEVYRWSLQNILKGTGWTHPALVLVCTFLPAIPNFGVQNNNNLLHIIVNSVHSNIFRIPWEEVKVDFHSYDNSP